MLKMSDNVSIQIKVIHRGAKSAPQRGAKIAPQIYKVLVNKNACVRTCVCAYAHVREAFKIMAGKSAGCVLSCTPWFRQMPKIRRDVTANGNFGFDRSNRFLTCRRLLKKLLGK